MRIDILTSTNLFKPSIIFIFASILVVLSSCYRHPHLNGETVGSVSGAVGGTLAAASQAGGNLIVIGAGTVAGSIVGGIIGSAFDDMDRYHQADPALWPIIIDCYQTRRPAYMAKFCPGLAVPPDNASQYANLPWTDYSF